MKKFFSPAPLGSGTGISLLRIVTGLFMVYHGIEVFDTKEMNQYHERLQDLHFRMPAFMAYLGKGIEFFGGLLLAIGLFTRLVIIPLTFTMLIIAFFVGKGNILMDDQHPFLFAMLFLVFFFTGPGTWSLDYVIFRKTPLNNRVITT